MPLDPSLIGHTYPPTEPYLVSREKIREFVDAIGAADAVFHDVGAARAVGHPDVVAPPTFAAVITSAVTDVLRGDAKLGLDFSRVVHGDQKIFFTRPVYAGDRLVSVCTIEDIKSRGGHELLTFRIDVDEESGPRVLSVATLFVVRGDG